MDPIHWFLDGKEDIRSSYYLEDVATEFQVQDLELDWACVTWDGDFRYSQEGWKCFSFVASKWQNINKEERKLYLKNAYRSLINKSSAKKGNRCAGRRGGRWDEKEGVL